MGKIIDMMTRQEIQPDSYQEQLDGSEGLIELIELQHDCADLRAMIKDNKQHVQQIDARLADVVIPIGEIAERLRLPVSRMLYAESAEWCLAELNENCDRIEELYNLGFHSEYDGLELSDVPIEYW